MQISSSKLYNRQYLLTNKKLFVAGKHLKKFKRWLDVRFLSYLFRLVGIAIITKLHTYLFMFIWMFHFFIWI